MNKMARTFCAAVAALTLGVQVQAAVYTDPNTGITFQGFTDTTGFQFGMALPTDPTTEFIAQIVSGRASYACMQGLTSLRSRH